MIAHARIATLVGLAALLAGCAGLPTSVPPGTPIAEVQAKLGPPTAQHTVAGGTRYEYATGPYGKFTYMLDFDGAGTLRSSRQVLEKNEFNAIRAGITRVELLATLGRPAKVWSVARPPQVVWSYRFDGPFCEMFNVGLGSDNRVMDTGYMPDPMCDARWDGGYSDRR